MTRAHLSAFISSAALIFVGHTALAQVTDKDASCRAILQHRTLKLGSSVNKAIDNCIKYQLKGYGSGDCNDAQPGNPTSDSRLKISTAASNLAKDVHSGCHENPHAAVLAEFPSCPSPANNDDDGELTTGVDEFDELAACEITLHTTPIEAYRDHILRPDIAAIIALPNPKDVMKCTNAVAKNVTKVWLTVAKYRGKCQRTSDTIGGPYDFVCSTDPGAGRIPTTIANARAAIDTACGFLPRAQLALLHSCATDLDDIKDCMMDAAVKSATVAAATAYEFPGVCPSEVTMAVNAGSDLTNTRLERGWTGFDHGGDVGTFATQLALSCTGPDCESCSVALSCDQGNCRCSNNATIPCSTPFVTGGPCGAGNTCIVHFGPPVPLSFAGDVQCDVTLIAQAVAGSADAGRGAWSLPMQGVTRAYLGISQSRPCPTCTGAQVGSSGNCVGGSFTGMPCTTVAVHPEFGATAYECQPSLALNVSGAGLKIDLDLTDGAVSLPFGDPCDSPLGAFACACGVCSGDNSVTCNGDADCGALALGTCEKGSSGANRRPNSCSDLSCEDADGAGPGEHGICSGEDDVYCNGFTHADGSPILPCTSNGDCQAVDSECPNSDCGDCTVSAPRRCFLNPIEAQGIGGTDGAELVSTFCTGPVTNTADNNAEGLPGPGRLKLDVALTAYCPDGTTEYELGGSNCP